ncbi:aggregation-promoting factor C-terminal-like domain-containing protein [Thermobifida halotolerans]|uniref:aggregation-promoting factor C-terminal-like domain-containing protein n=1 Tax=Thermobifida halotolerans TaxID=483545 RepID=UPI000837EE4F|nr:lytic transglycosylase domain-containing protein [Thermobifida halotolerans]
MLKNRISLRLATAAGTAALTVASAAFGFSAFADTGAQTDQTASAAILPNEADTDSFFPETEEGIPAGQLEQAGSQRDQAVNQAVATADGTLEEEKEEEEEPQQSIPSGDPRGIAQAMLADYGWSSDQFGCLDSLWEKESNWNHLAQNPSSGAYGIPQALPGSKMASAGDDWQTNPATQIKWGLGYIQGRYGSPCAAWEHSQSVGWY